MFLIDVLLSAVILFEASMEFLENADNNNEDIDEDDEDASSFVTAPTSPTFPPIAVETLPMRYDHTHWEEQAARVAMGGRVMPGRFDSALEDYYTLRLRGVVFIIMVTMVTVRMGGGEVFH